MKFESKIKLLIALSVALVLLSALAVGLHFVNSNETANTEPSETLMLETDPQVTTEPTEIPTQIQTEVHETAAPTQAPTEEPTQAPTAAPTQAPTESSSKPSSGGNSGTTGSSGTQTSKPSTSAPQATEAPSLKFPYSIPGTSLVIKQVNSYDGIFLEDGSDKNVTGISVIVLENKGTTGVEYANVTLTQSGKELQYKATALPAGATVVVQESSAAAYSSADISACTADVAQLETFEMSSSLVKVVENEDGTLNVTNLGSETIPCVRIFYKFAMEKGSIYVGGITYTAKLTQLEAGATQQVAPSHYAAGSSEIMMVRTYATAD